MFFLDLLIPRALVILDPRGLIGRIHVGDHLTLLQWFQRKRFLSFPIISLWELYVAMATIVPIQSALMQPLPLPDDDLHEI